MFLKQPMLSLSVGQRLSNYGRSLFRALWLIASLSAAGTALAVAVCALLPQSYQATATICYSTQSARETVAGLDPASAGAQFLAMQTKLIQADSVLRPVVNRYGLLGRENQITRPWFHVYSSEERLAIQKGPIVLRNLIIKGVPGTFCLNVTYSDRNPQMAADVANAVAGSFVSDALGTNGFSTRSFGAPLGEAIAGPKQTKSSAAEAQFAPIADAEEWNAGAAIIRVVKAAPSLPQDAAGAAQEQLQPTNKRSAIGLTQDRTGTAYRAALPSVHTGQCVTPIVAATAEAAVGGDGEAAPLSSRGHLGLLSDNLRLVNPARPPVRPTFPNWPLIVLCWFGGFSTSISVLVVLAGSRDFLTDDPDVITQLLGASVISKLPLVDNIQIWLRRGLGGTLSRGFCLEGILFDEGIRLLQNDILISSPKGTCESILVTSALPREGKTTVAVSLAVGYAMQGKRTLLIDADLRCPTVEERLRIFPPGKLESLLAKVAPWKGALSGVVGCPNLSVLSSPVPLPTAIAIVGGSVANILKETKPEFDVAIIDGPPLLGCGEASELGAIAGVTLLCVRSGRTPMQAQKAAVERLKQVGAKFGGIVLNQYIGRKDTVYSAYEKYHASHAARQNEPEVLWPSELDPFSSDTLRR